MRLTGRMLVIGMCGLLAASAWAIYAGQAPLVANLVSPLASPSPAGRTAYPLRVDLPASGTIQAGVPLAEGIEGDPRNALPQPLVPDDVRQSGRNSAEFAEAFRGGSPLVDVRFDIANYSRAAPAKGDRLVRTSKPLSLGGDRIGSIDLALGQGSVIAVDRKNLQALVAGKNKTLSAALAGMDGELVSFDALRDRGVRIRYDALADTIVIDSSG